ncbi:MAG: CoA pyrophosphatase [Pirellulaceae bacterium]|nr:CoA pyrophosphatase [Planctomycetales bacterium]
MSHDDNKLLSQEDPVARLTRWLKLSTPLPVSATAQRFAPELSFGRHFVPPPPDARRAAVMLLFYQRDNQWHLPLTLRPESMGNHAGQVSFPGGSIDDGESAEQAAVREVNEELGVTEQELQVLGSLSSIYLYNSNFSIAPIVAVAQRVPTFVPSPDEVAALIEFPLAVLVQPQPSGTLTIRRRDVVFTAPCIDVAAYQVWGATAIILGQLRDLLVDASP